jgi:hypothetical protein
MIDKDRVVFLRTMRRGVAELDLSEPNASRKLGEVPQGSSLYVLAPDLFCGMSERGGYWKYSGGAVQLFDKTAPENFIRQGDEAVAQVKNARRNRAEPMMVSNVRDVTTLSPGNALGLWATASGNCATVRYRNDKWYYALEVAGFSPHNVPNKAWFLDEKNFVAIGSDKVARCVDGKLTLQNLEVSGSAYPANTLTSVWGKDLSHYWTADGRGNVFYFDGAQWKLVARSPDLQPNEKFEDLWPVRDGSVIGVTSGEVYALVE